MRYRSKHNYSSGSRSGKGQKCRFGRALITYSDLYGLKDWEFKHIGIAHGEIDYVTSNPDIDPRGSDPLNEKSGIWPPGGSPELDKTHHCAEANFPFGSRVDGALARTF
jgi:hypothetical protein